KETEIATEKKDENSDTPVEAEDEKIQENKETIAADKKETNNSGNFSRHVLESYATEKKEGTIKPNKVEIIQEKEEPLEVVTDEDEGTKETTTAVNEKADPNAAKKGSAELTKSTNTSLLPERYKEFDKDENGAITYDEIIKMIDAFFDDSPNVSQEDITSIIDYFFGE
ncbi:MAG: hypothetical protein K8R85_15820, partial [Bacteroidetes bacterium]|nr:hypothetical protein [Bacteroidota bacterium]